MTLTVEEELALIRKNGKVTPAVTPAAPSKTLQDGLQGLSDTFQAVTTPPEAPEATPAAPDAQDGSIPPNADAPPAAAASAPPEPAPGDWLADSAAPPLETGLAAPPRNDASTWDVMAAAWRRDTIAGDVYSHGQSRRNALTYEMWLALPPEAQQRASDAQKNHRSDWRSFEQKVMDEAAQLVAKDPTSWGDLPLTTEQFEARLLQQDQAELAEAEAILSQPGGGISEFLGSAGRDLTRPINLALLPFGGFAGSAAKFVLTEAALSGVASVTSLLGKYRAAERLGLPDPDAVTEVATETVVGGLFAGALLGVAKGLNWAAGRNRTSIDARPDGSNPVDFGARVDAAEAELTGTRTVQEATFDWTKHRSQGGLREDAISGLDAEFRTSLEGLIASAPPEIRDGFSVFSGYRSIERQQELWDASDKSGKMVARPGHSKHNHGQAVDLEWNGARLDKAPPEVQAWVAANLEKFGLTRPMDYEAWHIEPIGARSGKGGAAASYGFKLPPGSVPYNEAAVLRGIIGAESSGKATAQNPNSSARGLGQFTADTWLGLVRKHRPELTEGKTPNEILALRDDPQLNAYMTAMYTRDNFAALQAAGVPTNPGELYLAHFMGPTGAVRALKSALDTPIAQLMTPKEIAANAGVRFGGKSFKDFTAGDLRRWSAHKMRAAYDPNASTDMPSFAGEGTSRGYTGSGQVAAGDDIRVDVDYEVVDYASLIRASGDLQPRDRSRINSDDWIAATAARLDPAQLMPSPNAATGTPIIGPDNVIESGNGRVSAIARAYERVPDRAQAYRGAIEAAGYSIPEGMQQPVLVARRRSAMTDADRRRFVVEAQDSGVAQMTPTEVARATARNLQAPVLARLDPAQPITADANGDFVRAALATLPKSARNAMFDPGGALNANGQRQLREALFARAWSDPDVLARYTEGTAAELKSLMEALEAAAPAQAALKADIEAGLVAPEMDISAYVLDAVRLIGAARDLSAKQGLSIAKAVQELLDEVDLLTGALSPLTTALVRKFWQNGRAAPADKVAEFLIRYANEARTAGKTGGMFDAPSPRDVLRTVDPVTFADLPEEFGRAKGFATPAVPQAAIPEAALGEGASSPEVAAIDAEIEATIVGEQDRGFGPILTGLTNDPEAAIERLMQAGTGEVPDAFVHPELGNIAFVWGSRRLGLRHILEKHGEAVLRDLPRAMREGQLGPVYNGRRDLVTQDTPQRKTVLRLDWEGDEKPWVLTSHDIIQGTDAQPGRTSNGLTETAPPSVPGATARGEDSPDLLPDQGDGQGPGLSIAADPELDAAAARDFDAQSAIAAARAQGADLEIEMPDGTRYSAAEVLDDLDQDATTDFQITFCTTNDSPGGSA